MELSYPWVLLLFLLYLFCDVYCKSQKKSIEFSNIRMLLIASKGQMLTSKILRHAVVFLMILSLGDPITTKQYQIDDARGHDISLIWDVSYSMGEDDRFERSREILNEFISNRENDRIALSVFADYAYVTAPLTYDKKVLAMILKYIKMGVAGGRDTALYEALYAGSDIFKASNSKNKIVILLTDGINTVHTIPISVAIAKAKKYGLKVYTIGLGDDYDEKVLTKIARETDGKFFSARNPKSLKEIYQEIDENEKSQIKSIRYSQKNHYFQYPLSLALILLLLWMYRDRKNKERFVWLVIALFFVFVTLYRPQIVGDSIRISKSQSTVMIGLDISASMKCTDVYPDRLSLAIQKFTELLDLLETDDIKVGLLAFSKQTYLISPPTDDYGSLKFLASHIDLSHIDRLGTSISSVMEATSKILDDNKSKRLILFTDGAEQRDFSDEIRLAKGANIQISIYGVATVKGGVITDDDKLVKDKQGNIVITSLNENIKKLARDTNGKYLKYTISNSDMKSLSKSIIEKNKQTKDTNSTIIQSRELYYLPLIIALLALLYPFIGFRRER